MATITVEMGGGRRRGEMAIPPYRGRDGETWSRAIIGGRPYEIVEVLGVWMTEDALKQTNEAMKLLR